MLGQDLTEIVQLLLRGQAAEQQQPDHFFKHEAVVAVSFLHDLVDGHTAVDQLAWDGDDVALLILLVTHDIADVGQASQHTCAVRVAQAALDAQPLAGLGVDVVVRHVLFAQSTHGGGVQSRHFRMCKIHGEFSFHPEFLLSHPPSMVDMSLSYRFCAVNSSIKCRRRPHFCPEAPFFAFPRKRHPAVFALFCRLFRVF